MDKTIERAIDRKKKAETIDKAARLFVEQNNMGPDMVNAPPHYALFPDMQAVDIIRKTLTRDEFVGYLKGNVLKYRLRAGKKKDAMQDIQKADWYETELWKIENK